MSGFCKRVSLVFVLPLAFGLAKRVEPDLGAINLVRLLVFANTAAALVLFMDLFLLYIVFREPTYLYDTEDNCYSPPLLTFPFFND
ncbi:hypothetical protein BBJ28_00002210 [Nothophytophthora sp. Chile5]|nr:hypothetical protein BBJ28_00002210 [Nothophytophthora sp. Chile5]